MPTVDTLRDFIKAWKSFGELPDDTALNVKLTALYLRVSVKTLARYRQNGDGPPYIKYSTGNSKARNQRVNYLLRDLKVWMGGHKILSTM